MNTLLLTLNLSLTACTAFLIRKNICLHLDTEKAIREQNIGITKLRREADGLQLKTDKEIKKQNMEIVKLKEDVVYRCLDLEKAIRGESEITQDQVQDIKECLDNTKDKLIKEVKEDLETINWNMICTNKIMDRSTRR